MEICPCGSNISYSACCYLFISGKKSAPTAEALMRSRFTAYSKTDLDYIERTMKGRALLNFDKQKSKTRKNKIKWTKLEIIKTFQQHTQDQDTKNARHFVEFIAYFTVDDQQGTLHECSEFLFENNQWYYIDGKIFP